LSLAVDPGARGGTSEVPGQPARNPRQTTGLGEDRTQTTDGPQQRTGGPPRRQ